VPAESRSRGVEGRTLVVTVTPNPSLDLLFEADALVWDDANRLADPRRRPGGQGINTTRAARALGHGSAAVALLGGPTGAELQAALAAEGTPIHAVAAGPPHGDTRTFVAVRERGTGRSLLLNAKGPARSESDAAALEAAAARVLDELRPAWIACCGSLPAGFPVDFYARLVRLARSAGCRSVVDCDGEALRLAQEERCDLLVPNQHEAERLTGHAIRDLDEACAAARMLVDAGTPMVAVTLGAFGAVLGTADGCWRAVPPGLGAGSAVGAGDAFLAGLLAALGSGTPSGEPAAVLRYAVAAGSAVLLADGPVLLDADAVAALLPRIR
jgi:1-phosphofructokinase family hexose kinase